MKKLEEVIRNLLNDVESTEHDYVVKCLREAVNYCFEQYHDTCGEIDPLSSIKELGLSNEDNKYELVELFLQHL